MGKRTRPSSIEAPSTAPRPLWRRIALRVLRNIVILGLIYLVAQRLLMREESEEQDARLQAALAESMRRARNDADAEDGPSAPTLEDQCRVRWRRTGEERGRVVLSLAEVMNHRQMLGLSQDQVTSINAAREECEAACGSAPEGDDRAAVRAHAQRVLQALSVLDDDQRRLVDEWLGGDTLREAAGHE